MRDWFVKPGPRWAVGGVVLAGLLLALTVVVGTGTSARDGVQLAGISFAAGLGLLLVGRSALVLAGRRLSPAAATVLVAAIPLAAVAVGTLVAARAMFVSSHDLDALLVVLAGAGSAGALGAVALAAELTVARRSADDARRREEEAERSRRELVASVSHDLRTPLSAVRAMVEALADGVVTDGPTIERYHQQMGTEVGRLTRLVDDLFELARIQADAVPLSVERISLGDLVSDAVASMAALAEEKGVRVEGAVARGDAEVAASPRELSRVVQNLLDNAIRHTPSGGSVVVRVDRCGGLAVLSVQDACGGIPEESLDRVFDLAYRGDAARGSAGGAGLGLAIARGLVEAHYGDIGVVNDGPGCRFQVRLPLA